MLETALTRRFGLSVPLVSAPMAGASGGALAAAVSRAGGLGTIGVGGTTPPEWVARQAAVASAEGKPYGIGLLAWSRPDENGQLEAVLDLEPRPALVSVSYGDPPGDERRHLPALTAAGSAVACQVGSPDDAKRALDDGFDLLVARGAEGGGHGRDVVATLPLLQAVLDLTDGTGVIVLAAGGIAGPRGLAAVLAAGAAGGWVGTAFLACPESELSEAAKQRLLAAGATDTVYTRAFDRGYSLGWPHEFGGRALRNHFTDTWTGRESDLADATSTEAERARTALAEARAAGDLDVAHVYAGQAAGLVGSARPASDVVAEFATAERLLRAW